MPEVSNIQHMRIRYIQHKHTCYSLSLYLQAPAAAVVECQGSVRHYANISDSK